MTSYYNREAEATSGERIRFSFGANWQKYLRGLDQSKIAEATESLRQSFDGVPFDGRSFLDAGCGSGLFSLAALRLGARSVTSLDVDPNSIAAADSLRSQIGAPDVWQIRQGSLLQRDFVAQIERADLVYSWGVLHHTGAMWQAVDNVLQLVRPSGLCCIALYTRPGKPRLHRMLKRLFNRTPRLLRPVVTAVYAAGWLASVARSGRNPARFVREYGLESRGMTFWRDAEDWLGGLPWEYASREEVEQFANERGFELVHLIERGRGANNDYLLRKAD